jgi:catechol 2,3-dioxygenase-like lactoylglutathione lyase family enzyme
MGLTQARAQATLPASDFERAKDFYAQKLGLTPLSDTPGGASYEAILEGGDLRLDVIHLKSQSSRSRRLMPTEWVGPEKPCAAHLP